MNKTIKITINKLFLLSILVLSMVIHSSCSLNEDFPLESRAFSDVDTYINTDVNSFSDTTEMFGEYYPLVEDSWHLSDWKETHPPIKDYWNYEDLDFSTDGMNICIKLPLEYEEIVDDVKIKVEFFQEKYPVFSYIQARISIMNLSDTMISVHESQREAAGVFLKNGIVGKGAHTAIGYDFDTGASQTVVLNKGDTFVGEVLYFATNDFFKTDGAEYEYKIVFTSYVNDTKQAYSISFPIVVCPIK